MRPLWPKQLAVYSIGYFHHYYLSIFLQGSAHTPMISLRGTLANLGLRYKIVLVTEAARWIDAGTEFQRSEAKNEREE